MDQPVPSTKRKSFILQSQCGCFELLLVETAIALQEFVYRAFMKS